MSERPLVVRFAALGDMIMLIPLLRSLAERWGRPCDLVAAGGSPRLVMQGLDCVGQIHTIRSRRTPFLLSPGQWGLVRWLRRRGPSPTWVVEEMAKVDWLLERGGVPASHRVGAADLPRGDVEHAVDYYRRLCLHDPAHYRGRAPAPATLAGDPELAVAPEEIEGCRRWIAGRGWEGRPLVLFQTQSRRLKRGRWPEERWVAVVRRVLEELPEARALLLGAPAEASEVETLRRACGDERVANVAHDLGLRRLFALTRLAHSMISLDSGPAHVATACGCPVVVLVGMADPRRNRPRGAAGVEIVTSVPEAQWPASRAEWEAWHRVAAIEVPPVVAAWHRLRSVSEEG